MYELLQQDDPDFLSLLNNSRMGTACDNDVDFIFNRFLDQKDDKVRYQFQKDANIIVPTRMLDQMIRYKYLDSFHIPLDKIKARLEYPCTH